MRPAVLRRLMIAPLLATASLCPAGSASAEPEDAAPIERLLAGVSAIGAPGVPGPLALVADTAFAVVTAEEEAVVAAGPLGEGRVVAFGHTGYLGEAALGIADTGRLLENALRWVAGDEAGRPGVLACVGAPAVAVRAAAAGWTVKTSARGAWARDLDGVDVVCADASVLREETIDQVSAWLRGGGGLVTASLGWGWLQLHPGRSLEEDHLGNRLLEAAGILWADGTLARTTGEGYAVDRDRLALAAASTGLTLLEAQAAGKRVAEPARLKQASASVLRAALAVREDHPFVARLRSWSGGEKEGRPLPTPTAPLGTESGLARVLLALEVRGWLRDPAAPRPAHPAAVAFPGAVPGDAPRVDRDLVIDDTAVGWRSTGLYAAPGDVIVLTSPEPQRCRVRIGAHSDRLWGKPRWSRVPEITVERPMDPGETCITSPFGGLLYVVVPAEGVKGDVRVHVSGAVQAPFFERGRTDPKAWLETRRRPAPWGELATGRVVLTVPSDVLRGLDDPEALLTTWDRFLDVCAELAARPPDRRRPERYVADVQISAGAMHSGYPIMTHLDAAETMADLEVLGRAGDRTWGLFHEMGHNHQSPLWTFDGTTEVTCNLFTLYGMERICGRGPREARPGFPLSDEQLGAYLGTGPDFRVWKQRPFLALHMYWQLQDAFGWEPFRDVFRDYRDLEAAARPSTDAEKRDQWLVRFSRRVGRDLGPFFEVWGVPTTEAARRSLADLPDWMPEGFPP